MDVKEQPLLSARTSLALGCISIGDNVEFVNRVSSARKKDRLGELLGRYQEVFSGLGRLPGRVRIHLKGDAVPVQCPPRRTPTALKEKIIERVKELEKQGIIVPVQQPTQWISQLLVVVRKGKKLRVTLDPYHLNKATRRSHYQLPVLSDILPRLTRARYFSVADASDGFYQCELEDDCTDLTTFWTPLGRYKYLRMPQGLNISPEVYQAKQMQALEGLRGVEVIADDVLIHGESFEDHCRNLEAFFERCRERNLRLNKNKLRLCVPEVKYMGHILSRQGIRPDPEKDRFLQSCKEPSDRKALLRFLGATNYLSKFIPGYSEITTPLRRLLRDNVDFAWMESQEKAFETLKQALTKPAILTYYDVSNPILIQTDASQNGVGAVLLQEGRPVDLCSSALRSAEMNYAVIEKELLAIVVACKKFDHYIFGHAQVAVETDHQPLISCFRRPLHSNPKRLQRMLLYLQKYDLDVRYVRGKANCLADWLSRDTLQKAHSTITDESLIYRVELEDLDTTTSAPISNSTIRKIEAASVEDEESSNLRRVIRQGWPSTKEKCYDVISPFWKYRSELVADDKLITRGSAVFIPRRLRGEMLKLAHASHYSFLTSWKRARDCIFWPSLKSELRDWCESCAPCQTYMPRQQREPLMITQSATYPFQIIHQDLFSIGNKNYLVTVDDFSDFFEIDELGRDTTSEKLIRATQRHFSRYGIPMELHSDNGTQLTSQRYADFLASWNVVHVTSSPYFAQSNGKAESAVKVAKRLLKKCAVDGEDYEYALLELRNTLQSDGSSRAQKFLSRPLRTKMPSRVDKAYIFDKKQLKKNKLKKQRKKKSWDKRARPLKTIRTGSIVRVQPLRRKGKWRSGTCIGGSGLRSYKVRLADGSEIRRNRRHLRAIPSTRPATEEQVKPSSTIVKERQRKRKTMDTTTQQSPRRSTREKRPRIMYSPE